MRVLILSCNTGEGHNSAARAVKEQFDNAKVVCEIADALAFLSPKASTFICKWHVRLYKKAPVLFGIGYKAAELTMPDKINRSMLYEIMAKGAKKLAKKISSDNYDTVICTHPFAGMMLTKAMRKYKVKVKSYFVATDYTCSPGVSESKLDCYFIPHESLKPEFMRHGFKEEQLEATGIPVSGKFVADKTKAESKKALGLPENKRVIILMCGSMGCGPMKLIARTVSEIIKDDEYLVVICGSNSKLYKSLSVYEREGSARVVGYTRNMPDYMNSAELILTKPGGLSTTEAAANKLPMVLIHAVSGCETHNMKFWTENNMAKTCEKSVDICRLVRDIMDNPDELVSMRSELTRGFGGSAAEKIYEFIANRG